jgi:hypothetical protein
VTAAWQEALTVSDEQPFLSRFVAAMVAYAVARDLEGDGAPHYEERPGGLLAPATHVRGDGQLTEAEYVQAWLARNVRVLAARRAS